jgi:DNA polymerase
MVDIFIDVETYSSEDLKESGVYRYVEAPDFSLLWLSFLVRKTGLPDTPIRKVDATTLDETGKQKLRNMLLRPDVRLHAHNVQFERIALNKWLGIEVPISKWHCTMARALMCGLPGGLDAVAEALGLIYGKMAGGRTLINYFSKPRKSIYLPGKGARNLPRDNADTWVKWQQFGEYNARDVEIEVMVHDKLSWYEISEQERRLWELDQTINDRGIRVDLALAATAMRLYNSHAEVIVEKLRELTGLDNPTSLPQMKAWITDQEPALEGITLNKESTEGVFKRVRTKQVRQALELRGQLSSISIQKYQTILRSVCANGRIHGTIQYYGAGRTGRWAGRGVQPHNLVKTEIENVELARELLSQGDDFMLKAIWDEGLPYCLSQLIRTALVPSPGHTFAISDFSAIEAVVLSWYAGEKWRLDVFRGDGLIYEACAARMFKIPIESIDKKSPWRKRGKVAELAFGYQGAEGALIRMGALKMGIKEEELSGIKYLWRSENKRIVAYWYAIENAFRECLRNGSSKEGLISMQYRNKRLTLTLPSGRQIIYQQPKVAGDGSLSYMGTHPINKRWVKIDTYGGKIVENIVQATARDLLAEALMRLDNNGFNLVLHVHDEVVAEVPSETAEADRIKIDQLMRVLPSWATDLPLKAVTTLSPFYRKD